MTPGDVLSQWAYSLLRFDHALQYAGMAASILGVGCTLYAIAEFIRHVHQLNGVQRMVAQSHIVGQSAILLVQVLFLTINILVLTMPDVPVAMYVAADNGGWVIFVIMARKILRFTMITVLAMSSMHRVWTFHRLVAALRTDRMHAHRRTGD